MGETIAKPAHRKSALKKGDFGSVQHWSFNDSYIFLNFDKEKLEHIKSLDEVDILSEEDSDRLWKEKGEIKVKGKDGRERSKLQGAVIRLRGTTSPTGKWMMDFCNEIGDIYGTVTMFEKLVAMYNETSLSKLKKKPAFKTIVLECMMMNAFSDRAFDEQLGEEEILNIVGKYKSLPLAWRKIKWFKTKELKHYMSAAKKVELNVEVISEEKKKNTLKAEEILVKNVEEETLKTEYNGHAPYGRGACDEIKQKIERRDKDGDSSDVKLAKRLIGEKIYLDGTGCYYCGVNLGVHVKDENNAEYFMWERGENYRNKIDIPGVCEMSDKKSRVNTYELNFPTGEVVIDNYFNPVDESRGSLFDIPKDEQYSDKYDLQTLKGRFNRQDYLSKTHNLGYAQMGNMSMDVFVSKDGNKLIFGDKPEGYYDKKPTAADKKFNKKFKEEYTHLGKISLSVWCWECTDKKTLTDAGHSGEGAVTAKVTPGTYTVKHIFGSGAFKEKVNRYNIYSEITLKAKK
jgi:hypothetical protein